MATAKFKVGQMVRLKSAVRYGAIGEAASYKILRLLHWQGRWSYHLKTILESDGRFAEQDDLVLASAHWKPSVCFIGRY